MKDAANPAEAEPSLPRRQFSFSGSGSGSSTASAKTRLASQCLNLIIPGLTLLALVWFVVSSGSHENFKELLKQLTNATLQEALVKKPK